MSDTIFTLDMLEDKQLRQAIEEQLDRLTYLPEDQLRQRLFRTRCRNVDFIWEIGGTEYSVVSSFKQDDAECLIMKMVRLVEGDTLTAIEGGAR